jgi:hypothetical protein
VVLVMPATSGRNYCVFPVARLDPRRRYVANNASMVCAVTTMYVESESDYVFGVLQSSMHRAWVYALCGTNGPSTRYNTQLYRSFVWPPAPSGAARSRVEAAARAVIAYRDGQPSRSLHALYCREEMEEPLATLHCKLDDAVEEAYGLCAATAPISDATRFAFLASLFDRETKHRYGGGGDTKKRQTTIGEMFLPKRTNFIK